MAPESVDQLGGDTDLGQARLMSAELVPGPVVSWWSARAWMDRVVSYVLKHHSHRILLAKSSPKDSPKSKDSSPQRWNELKNPIGRGMDRDE